MNWGFVQELIRKALIIFGVTYFTAVMSTGAWTTFLPTLAMTGLYIFTELARFYRVNIYNEEQKMKKKAMMRFAFLI